MGKRDDALALLRQGLTPPEIAARQGVTLDTILGYLDQLVGRGRLRRSEIYFTMRADVRDGLAYVRKIVKEQSPQAESWQVVQAARSLDLEIPAADLEVVWHYGDPRNFLGDMYEDLASMELHLHVSVRRLLESAYGSAWWTRAVPQHVREECEGYRARARQPGESPYLYTSLMHLHDIVKEQWQVVKELFVPNYSDDREPLLKDLRRLNAIRNKVMHPVRGEIPTEEEFLFVQRLRRSQAPEAPA